jgi:hypothetical protein
MLRLITLFMVLRLGTANPRDPFFVLCFPIFPHSSLYPAFARRLITKITSRPMGIDLGVGFSFRVNPDQFSQVICAIYCLLGDLH